MEQNEKNWESTTSKDMSQSAGLPLVKSIGCAACWAAKSISLTRACWIPTIPSRAI
ncbi:sporulation killing factor [Paenibacillus sp. 481]|uniref:sporulation killing factor n=1 Tax=Paenibacillus sp. 481 TaxID=2835869 RepID=UPI001E36248C|nr:sporulation killing factor [Paenibacillus sp. 481]UHA71978.1 sporulation killing factor [Paenibacillus sp. 481]